MSTRSKNYIIYRIHFPNAIWQTTTIAFTIINIIFTSCTKLVEIDAPVNSITTEQIFSDSINANSAILGIYSKLSNANFGSIYFGNGAVTIYAGESSDELIPFVQEPSYLQFYLNDLQSINGNLAPFWNSIYSTIYQTNACIEGITSSPGLSGNLKNRLIGETKVIRAFCYFYLANLFGDIPYVTTPDWEQTALSKRIPVEQVYEQLMLDLDEAIKSLPDDYALTSGERIRATKWAATALLSRIYLYSRRWPDAEKLATNLIERNDLFDLSHDLNEVFFRNSRESILQWQTNSKQAPYNATAEGNLLIPFDSTFAPYFYLSDEFLSSFEKTDQRKVLWLDSSTYDGHVYYYPYKYKVGAKSASPNAPTTEYYTILRLSEQYLIRAEARVEQNDLPGGISDINVVRSRAGLPNLSLLLSKEEARLAIEQERRIELFCEWGHRWLDLKRTNRANTVLSSIKRNNWQTTDQLYPIPLAELTNNPNLTQNPGY